MRLASDLVGRCHIDNKRWSSDVITQGHGINERVGKPRTKPVLEEVPTMENSEESSGVCR